MEDLRAMQMSLKKVVLENQKLKVSNGRLEHRLAMSAKQSELRMEQLKKELTEAKAQL